MDIQCKICNKIFKRTGKAALKAVCCSTKCLSVYRKASNNTTCTQCNKQFHMKESQKKKYKREHGYFCSTLCVAEFRKIKYVCKNNPNFKPNVTRDWDGYKLAYIPRFGRIKLHHKVVFEYLGIEKLPEGYSVHHRDCNVDNNIPKNLVLLNNSDHRWLHKQFGSAVLWAYYNNKISLKKLINWSNDIERAKRILPLNIVKQKKSGVFKLGELLENPEEDNQQPS